ncbi:unnamed protein product, partial [Bubo scandiacus]
MQNPNRRLNDDHEHISHSKDCRPIMLTCLRADLGTCWGPYTVLLTSYFAAKVAEKDNQGHHSHVKQLPKEYQLDGPLSTPQNSINPTLEI